jgi:hypothetical protein
MLKVVREVKIENMIAVEEVAVEVKVVGFAVMIEASITVLQEREAIGRVLNDIPPTNVEDHLPLPPLDLMVEEEDIEEEIMMMIEIVMSDSVHVS